MCSRSNYVSQPIVEIVEKSSAPEYSNNARKDIEIEVIGDSKSMNHPPIHAILLHVSFTSIIKLSF